MTLLKHFKNIVVLEPSQEQNHLCAKEYPNRFLNGREKCEQTDKHFRIKIKRDGGILFIPLCISIFLFDSNFPQPLSYSIKSEELMQDHVNFPLAIPFSSQ